MKWLLLSPERSYRRKIQEIILSIRHEHHASKTEILTVYPDQIYLSSGAYGVETAASYTQAMEAWKERFSFSSR